MIHPGRTVILPLNVFGEKSRTKRSCRLPLKEACTGARKNFGAERRRARLGPRERAALPPGFALMDAALRGRHRFGFGTEGGLGGFGAADAPLPPLPATGSVRR